MSVIKHQQDKHTVILIKAVKTALLLQLAVILMLAGIAMLHSPAVALAVVLGGVISLLPNAYFAGRVLLVPAPLDARLRLRQLYAAEATKLLISALLFALVLGGLKQIPPAIVLAGFIIAHVAYLTGLAWQHGRLSRAS